MKAASCSGDFRRRHEGQDQRCGDEKPLEDVLEHVQVGEAGVVLPPVPERERRLAPDLRRQRPVVEDTRRVHRIAVEEQDRERGHRRGEEGGAEDQRGPYPAGIGVGRPERRDHERRELRPPGERDQSPARGRRGDEPEAEDQQHRPDRVVRVRAGHVLRERVRGPREGQRDREPASAEAQADEPEADHGEDVEHDRREAGGVELVALAGPADCRVPRQVSLVRDRTVRVSGRRGRFAAAVRLDEPGVVAVRVGRGARLRRLRPGSGPTGSRRSRCAARRRRLRSRRRSRSSRRG